MEGLEKVIQKLPPKNARRKFLLLLNEQVVNSLSTEVGGSIYSQTYFGGKNKNKTNTLQSYICTFAMTQWFPW